MLELAALVGFLLLVWYLIESYRVDADDAVFWYRWHRARHRDAFAAGLIALAVLGWIHGFDEVRAVVGFVRGLFR
jgi:hypothetical protein